MKILVVEDEHKVAQAIKKGLEQESFVVDIAFDGQDGFDLATSEPYNVIVLDRMLPKIDGVTFCKKLREDRNHTPVLMLTAKGQITDRVEGLNSGADDYLVKPFAFEELLARIRALARRPKEQVETILTCEDVTLNTQSFVVQRGTTSIKLSSKEYALLEYMLRNKGKILTKDQIIQHVWSYEADVLPNTVEVYIGYLRKKIDAPFKSNSALIHTIRGFGYKIGEG